MRHIRITEIPPGEAPTEIRAAWVGVVLQLADTPESQPSAWNTIGVLGKDRGLSVWLRRSFGVPAVEQPSVGYVVEVIAAIESLRNQSPSAASWWERNTPHLLMPGRKFLFAASCCEEVENIPS